LGKRKREGEEKEGMDKKKAHLDKGRKQDNLRKLGQITKG